MNEEMLIEKKINNVINECTKLIKSDINRDQIYNIAKQKIYGLVGFGANHGCIKYKTSEAYQEVIKKICKELDL